MYRFANMSRDCKMQFDKVQPCRIFDFISLDKVGLFPLKVLLSYFINLYTMVKLNYILTLSISFFYIIDKVGKVEISTGEFNFIKNW